MVERYDFLDNPEDYCRKEEKFVGVEIRRRRQTLYYSGQAFIMFGIWSTVKLILWVYLEPVNWVEQIETVGVEISDLGISLKQLFYVTIAILSVIIGLFRFYIGLSAMGEGKGKRKRFTYVVVAALYMIAIVCSYAQQLDDSADQLEDTLITWILDVSSVIALMEIIVNAWKIRKLEKPRESEQ